MDCHTMGRNTTREYHKGIPQTSLLCGCRERRRPSLHKLHPDAAELLRLQVAGSPAQPPARTTIRTAAGCGQPRNSHPAGHACKGWRS